MGFLGGFGEIPRNFFGFRFLPPFDHPRHVKSGFPPRGNLGSFVTQRHTALHVEPSLERENDQARLHFRCALTVEEQR